MRFPVFIFVIMASIASCNQIESGKRNIGATPEKDSIQLTSIEWKEKSINFGRITEGQKLEVVYHFTNTGSTPLIISKVEPGCGCTVADTPTEPIAPGKQGIIKGAFDSNGKAGTQHKSIFVSANTRGTQHHELVFTVEVDKKS